MLYKPPSFSFSRFFVTGLGCAAAIVVAPMFMLVKLVTLPFEKPLKRTPDEVLHYLRLFFSGTDGAWDWDNFTTQPIADPRLDDIKDRLAALDVPLSDEDLPAIQSLIAETEAILAAEKRDAGSSPA